jgi:uncharacterized membrane protein YfbV (UPF0208 family)
MVLKTKEDIMSFLAIVIILLLLPLFGRWLAKLCSDIQETIEQKEQRKQKYMTELLSSIKGISNTLNPPEEKPDYVGSLFNANKEIREKEMFNEALEKELGINTTD